MFCSAIEEEQFQGNDKFPLVTDLIQFYQQKKMRPRSPKQTQKQQQVVQKENSPHNKAGDYITLAVTGI